MHDDLHDELDRRLLAAIEPIESVNSIDGGPDTVPARAFIEAVARRRRARRLRAGGALAVALVLVVGGAVHLLSPAPVEQRRDLTAPPDARAARVDRPSLGALAGDPDWLSRSISLVGFSASRGDEAPIALRMSRDDEAIDLILDRMMTGS